MEWTSFRLLRQLVSVRRFSDADRTAGKAIKDAVTRGGSLWTLRTEALLGMGRIDEARTVIESGPKDMTRLVELIRVAIFARDFARENRKTLIVRWKGFGIQGHLVRDLTRG